MTCNLSQAYFSIFVLHLLASHVPHEMLFWATAFFLPPNNLVLVQLLPFSGPLDLVLFLKHVVSKARVSCLNPKSDCVTPLFATVEAKLVPGLQEAPHDLVQPPLGPTSQDTLTNIRP